MSCDYDGYRHYSICELTCRMTSVFGVGVLNPHGVDTTNRNQPSHDVQQNYSADQL